MSKHIDLKMLNPNLRLVFWFFFSAFIKKIQNGRQKCNYALMHAYGFSSAFKGLKLYLDSS